MAMRFHGVVVAGALAACAGGDEGTDSQRGGTRADEAAAPRCDGMVRRVAEGRVSAIEGDSAFLFYGTLGDNAIWRLSKDGGEPELLADEDVWQPSRIVLEDEWVYWSGGGDEHSLVFRVPKDGGAAHEEIASRSWDGGLDVAEGWAYYAGSQDDLIVRRLAVPFDEEDPPPSQRIAEDVGSQDTPLAHDEAFLYFVGQLRNPEDTGWDRVFFRVPLEGGEIEELARFDDRFYAPADLEIAGGFLIAHNVVRSSLPGESAIVCLPKTGGETAVIADWGDARGVMSTVEDSMAFAEIEGDTARIRVTSLVSGEPQTIAEVAAPVHAMHYDGECVYFGRGGDDDPGLFVVAAR